MSSHPTSFGPAPHTHPGDARRGFTLFEVGISLLLVSFGVVSVLMLFPVGLKQTQASKYKVIAAAKAVELIDTFSGTSDESRTLDIEAPEAWEGKTFAYGNCRWDLEQHTCNFRYGIHPLPDTIARRLDSEGQEILGLLDEGTQIYYTMPMANSNLDERWQNSAPLNEARNLIFAVKGSPQHNALHRLPQKAWPYHYPYPSPPMYTDGGNHYYYKDVPYLIWDDIAGIKFQCLEWWFGSNSARIDYSVSPTGKNTRLEGVFKSFLDYAYDHKGVIGLNQSDKKLPLIKKRREYITKTIEYCEYIITQRLRLPMVGGIQGATEFERYILPAPASGAKSMDGAAYHSLGQQYDLAFAEFCMMGEYPMRSQLMPSGNLGQEAYKIIMQYRTEAALRVQCLRYLAHAMATLATNKYSSGNPLARGDHHIRRVEEEYDAIDNDNARSQDVDNLGESTTVLGKTITAPLIRYLHERSLAAAMRYTACFPYDWGQPRPQQRNIMVDIPLIELDLFSPPRQGRIGGQVAAAMWKPITAQPISNIGYSSAFPGTLDATGQWRPGLAPYKEWDAAQQEQSEFWGEPTHFSLTKTFSPSERCRQLVFWSVDWQTYEDFETAPAATVDACRHPMGAPWNGNQRNLDQRLGPGNSNGDYPYGNAWRNADTYFMLHPEVRMLFTNDVSGLATGANVSAFSSFDRSRDISPAARQDKAFCGMYGADRNFNRQLDRGPVSRNVRLRASAVARFNYYDPRIPVVMR